MTNCVIVVNTHYIHKLIIVLCVEISIVQSFFSKGKKKRICDPQNQTNNCFDFCFALFVWVGY